MARGLVLSAGLRISDNLEFILYSGGIFHEECKTYNGTNHAVNFVGYGTIKNTKVWILKNSWGDFWGDDGFFYVEIGKDTLCLEHRAFALLPLDFNDVLLNSTVARKRKYLDDDDGVLIINGKVQTSN